MIEAMISINKRIGKLACEIYILMIKDVFFENEADQNPAKT